MANAMASAQPHYTVCTRLTLDVCKKSTQRPVNMERIANFETYSCLIPDLDNCEMGASTNRFDVKCFFSVVMTRDFEFVLWLGVGLRTGIDEG
jgi:hypothetical protein